MSESSGTVVRMQHTAAIFDVVVTGILPIGETTQTITHFIIDMASKTVVGQVALPNAVAKRTAVALPVKVPNDSGAYAIGTFDDRGGFLTSSFLSIDRPASGSSPIGAAARPA